MFSKARSPEGAAAAPASARSSGVPSIISPDLAVTGDLRSAGDIQVDGTVRGDVEAANLTIGEDGAVHGKVSARVVRICGTVSGAVHAGSVTLAATARVDGDIVHDSLAVEAGAYVDGHCKRRETATADKAAPQAGRGAAAADGKQEAAATPVQGGSANGAGGDTGKAGADAPSAKAKAPTPSAAAKGGR